jgi:hypothetical protein
MKINANSLIPTCLLALGATLSASAQSPLADPIPLPIPTSEIKVKLTPVLTGLASPLELKTAEGRSDRAYILDQTGLILVWSGRNSSPSRSSTFQGCWPKSTRPSQGHLWD